MAQRARPNQEREFPQTLTKPDLKIFERWAVDLIGILPTTPAGNKWLFTAIEYVTGWPVAVPLPDAKEETIAKTIHEHIAMIYGPPRELFSDNGSNFVGKAMKQYLALLKIIYRTAISYHSRTNRVIERFNNVLGDILTKYLVNRFTRLWDQYVS